MAASQDPSQQSPPPSPSPPLWLGLDLSTQSLTLVLLPDKPGQGHVYLDSLVYARDLPQYQTEHGMHIDDGDNGEKVRCRGVGVGEIGNVCESLACCLSALPSCSVGIEIIVFLKERFNGSFTLVPVLYAQSARSVMCPKRSFAAAEPKGLLHASALIRRRTQSSMVSRAMRIWQACQRERWCMQHALCRMAQTIVRETSSARGAIQKEVRRTEYCCCVLSININ